MIGDHTEALRNATGSPRGSLRLSLHPREPPVQMPRARPVDSYVRRSEKRVQATSVKHHGTSPWHVLCVVPNLATIVTIHGTSPWHSSKLLQRSQRSTGRVRGIRQTVKCRSEPLKSHVFHLGAGFPSNLDLRSAISRFSRSAKVDNLQTDGCTLRRAAGRTRLSIRPVRRTSRQDGDC